MASIPLDLIPKPPRTPSSQGVVFDTQAPSGAVNADGVAGGIAQAGAAIGGMMQEWAGGQIDKEKKADLANAVAELEVRYTKAGAKIEALRTSGGMRKNLDEEIEKILEQEDRDFDAWLGASTDGIPNVRWQGVRSEIDQVRKARMAQARVAATKYVIEKSKAETRRRWDRTMDEAVKSGSYQGLDLVKQGMLSAGYDPAEVDAVVGAAKTAADQFRIGATLDRIAANMGQQGFDATAELDALEARIRDPKEGFQNLSQAERDKALVETKQARTLLQREDQRAKAEAAYQQQQAEAMQEDRLAAMLFEQGALTPQQIRQAQLPGKKQVEWAETARRYAEARASREKDAETTPGTRVQVNTMLGDGTLTQSWLNEEFRKGRLSAADFDRYSGNVRSQAGASSADPAVIKEKRARQVAARTIERLEAMQKAGSLYAGVATGDRYWSGRKNTAAAQGVPRDPLTRRVDPSMVVEPDPEAEGTGTIVVNGERVLGWDALQVRPDEWVQIEQLILDRAMRDPDADLDVYAESLLFPYAETYAQQALSVRLATMSNDRRRRDIFRSAQQNVDNLAQGASR